jgi:hypothetical protein
MSKSTVNQTPLKLTHISKSTLKMLVWINEGMSIPPQILPDTLAVNKSMTLIGVILTPVPTRVVEYLTTLPLRENPERASRSNSPLQTMSFAVRIPVVLPNARWEGIVIA